MWRAGAVLRSAARSGRGRRLLDPSGHRGATGAATLLPGRQFQLAVEGEYYAADAAAATSGTATGAVVVVVAVVYDMCCIM